MNMIRQSVFQGVVCGYEVKIISQSYGMNIVLWNQHKKRHYQVFIPAEMSGKAKEIQKYFNNFDQFLLYFSNFAEDKNRIFINDKGTIKVTYFLKQSMKKPHPFVYIQTQVFVTGSKIKDEAKIYKQISDVKKENISLQNKIQQLEVLNKENKKRMDQLRKFLAKRQKRYVNSSSSSSDDQRQKKKKKKHKKQRKKYSVISSSKNGANQLQDTLKQLKQQINVIKPIISHHATHVTRPNFHINPALTKQQQYMSQLQIYGQKMIITVDKFNEYLQKNFKIQGNMIEKIEGYGRYQILSNQIFPLFKKTYVSIYLQKITARIFSIGIVSQTKRNFKNSHSDKDLITYYGKTGAIYQNGDCRSGGPQLREGSEIRISVDLVKFKVTWFSDKKEVACNEIPEHLRKARLVVYLQINYEKDRVYLNEKPSQDKK